MSQSSRWHARSGMSSVREGHDPSDFALCCYAEPAPQHACRVKPFARIPEILIHPLAGVLSGWHRLADRRLVRRRQRRTSALEPHDRGARDANSTRGRPLVGRDACAGAAEGSVPCARAR